jgi:hypothetical protein
MLRSVVLIDSLFLLFILSTLIDDRRQQKDTYEADLAEYTAAEKRIFSDKLMYDLKA